MPKPTPGSLATGNLCLFVAIASAAFLEPDNQWWYLLFSVLGIGLNAWWLQRDRGGKETGSSRPSEDDPSRGPSEDERERVMQELDEEAERRRKQRDVELN